MDHRKDRLTLLRKMMKREKIDWYLIPTGDFHNSEYINDYFKVSEFFSGFTGSNGTLVISEKECGLWTDGRYFIQAEMELAGSGIKLYRMLEENVPTIEAFLEDSIEAGQVLAFDGRVVDAFYGNLMEKIAMDKNAFVRYETDLAEEIWQERPKLPHNPMIVLEEGISGEKTEEKLCKVRKKIKEAGASSFFLSKLDDLMWLFNIRGSDIPCNPVALSYAFITETEAILFVQQESITSEVRQYALEKNIILKNYWELVPVLTQFSYQGKAAVDIKNVSYTLYRTLGAKTELVELKNPTQLLKAVKNKIEQQNMREVYKKDSAVLTKFIFWCKHTGKNAGITELEAAEYLDRLRGGTEGFLSLSFPTISAYQENGAMMHYQATREKAKNIRAEGSLLVDSGGQYMGGTTDVTRTIVLGRVPEAFKMHFTYVMIGMLQLMNAKFLHGCTGRNLDILARQPLWKIGVDYKCGTGHGIGYMLNVHEGPQSIRWRYNGKERETVLEEGMVVSNEPGVYIAGQYGIRTENIMLCRNGIKNEEGQFLFFEPLTLVPIDREAIDVNLLNESDLRQINAYHELVYREISPYLEEAEQDWLRKVTEELF